MLRITLLSITLITLIACDKPSSSDATKKRARAEQEAGTSVENKNLAQKAQQMEQDLERRYRFFKGLNHDYYGVFSTPSYTFNMKLTLTPTLHVIDPGRVRTLEEIQQDINNLMFNAQVKIWNTEGSTGVPGCIFQNIRPDLSGGVIQLVANDCANRFTIKLSNGEPSESLNSVSTDLAIGLLNQNINNIDFVHVESNSKFNPQGYEALLKREVK